MKMGAPWILLIFGVAILSSISCFSQEITVSAEEFPDKLSLSDFELGNDGFRLEAPNTVFYGFCVKYNPGWGWVKIYDETGKVVFHKRVDGNPALTAEAGAAIRALIEAERCLPRQTIML